VSATVLEPAARPTPVALRTPATLRNPALLPVMCELPVEAIRSCQVAASVEVDGVRVTVGRGSAGAEGRPVARKLAVPVELTDLGRGLVVRDGGATLLVEAVVQGVGTGSYTATAPLHVAAR
jgi:hypothetical protein